MLEDIRKRVLERPDHYRGTETKYLLDVVEEQRKVIDRQHLLLDQYETLLNADEDVLSLLDKYKEALNKLDEVLHFDEVEETWMDETMLGVESGTALMIRENHIAVLKRLNEAKKFAKSALEKE